MKEKEFKEQDDYCRINNVPGGEGCDNCPAKDKNMCADRLRGLCGKLLKLYGIKNKGNEWEYLLEEIKKYGLREYNLLVLHKGIIEFNE